MVLLHTGKVLVWSKGDQARVWNPTTGDFQLTPAPFGDTHCAAQVTLADGRILVVGGQNNATHVGINVTSIFDPLTQTWSRGADMAKARWYPTLTTMSDGRALVVSGDDENGARVDLAEIYDPATDTWTPTTPKTAGLYPFMYQLPDGRMYEAGTKTTTSFFDVQTGKWSAGPTAPFGSSAYSESGAMYEPGKILRAGGGDPAMARTQVIDMNAASPAWEETSPMAFPRRRMNTPILLDGSVMAVGGTRQSDDASQAILQGEIWSPGTKQWSEVASMAEPRMYHSTALTLPDGRVVTAGGEADGILRAQVYSPPYLFKGPRPAITSNPSSTGYGATFSVGTDATDVAKVPVRGQVDPRRVGRHPAASAAAGRRADGRLQRQPADRHGAPQGRLQRRLDGLADGLAVGLPERRHGRLDGAEPVVHLHDAGHLRGEAARVEHLGRR